MIRDMMVLCGALFAMIGFQTPTRATGDLGAVFRDAQGGPTAVARSVSDFGHAILKKVAAKEGNACVSPVSLWLPFTLVYQASSGESRRQMAAVLHPADEAATLAGAWSVLAALDRPTPGFAVTVRNAAWFHPSWTPSPEFLNLATGPFGSKVFDGSESDAKEAINAWVSEVTRGRIPSLVDDSSGLRLMVLANAAYLKAEWADPFDERKTSPRPFRADGKRVVQVPTMADRIGVYRVPHRDLLIAAFPYKRGAGWLFVAMPKDGKTMADLWRADLATLVRSVSSSQPEVCEVTMPKWRQATDLDLRPVLSEMGMAAPWESRGEFSMIHPAASLNRTVHKSRFAVDEKGTEAAAATDIVWLSGGRHPRLTFDRPFYYAVIERTTGLPFFAGVLNDPSR